MYGCAFLPTVHDTRTRGPAEEEKGLIGIAFILVIVKNLDSITNIC